MQFMNIAENCECSVILRSKLQSFTCMIIELHLM